MTVKYLPLLSAGCLLPHTMGVDICNPGGCLVSLKITPQREALVYVTRYNLVHQLFLPKCFLSGNFVNTHTNMKEIHVV